MCNFGRKHQRYLAVQNKSKVPGLDIVAYIILQQSLHKIRWSSGSLTSGRLQQGM